jgi:uncharacterized membrane protein YsdA (DUF1294 family)
MNSPQVKCGISSVHQSQHYVNSYTLYGALSLTAALCLALVLALLAGWGWLAAWLLAINLVAFCAYGYDKLIAGTGVVRVPERILLGQVLLGAVVLAPLARWLFRHKTRKVSFRVQFWTAEVVAWLWIGGFSYLAWLDRS